jgi:putative transposase
MSVLQPIKKRKQKTKQLNYEEVKVLSSQDYEGFEVDTKVELIRSLIPIGLMHIYELLDAEVQTLAGDRYARRQDEQKAYRHGTNPGSVRLAGQKVPVKVPRLRNSAGEVPLSSYAALNNTGDVDERLLKQVLFGISCRNYEAAAEAIPGAIGLSHSTVSRKFVKASASELKRLKERTFYDEDIIALFLDGKTFADATMVIALGITITGQKIFLGFTETDTENAKVITTFLNSLIDRGLNISKGILVVVDGSKGLKSAVKKAFGGNALIQRCQWHKRENVVSYLPKKEQDLWRNRLTYAYNRPTYKEAHGALDKLHKELDEINQSAASSLAEGLEETLTLHRLGVYAKLGRSFKTTNCLESVNSLVEERCSKVDCWKNSDQRQRWLATALLDIEPRLYRVKGYRHLSDLRDALMRELGIEDQKSVKAVV